VSLRVAVVSHLGVGAQRGGRERNEDSWLVCQDGRVRWLADGIEHEEERDGEGVLVAVFDGMGGHADGHVASATAARVLSKLYQPGTIPERPARVLSKYVLDAHRQLHAIARAQGSVRMGTTLTAVWLFGQRAAWVHVGDSRLYVLRAGKLDRVTSDQTRGEFARRDSRTPVSDGDRLAQNFIYGSRGLGDDERLRLDAGKDSGTLDLLPGDRLLLCSDGITSVLDDPTIEATLQEADIAASPKTLVERALERESRDNVTAIVVG